jgi:hypothetical protein
MQKSRKKIDFGEINGDIIHNVFYINRLCTFLSLTQKHSAQDLFELYLTT